MKCQYCATSVTHHTEKCPACGAPSPLSEPECMWVIPPIYKLLIEVTHNDRRYLYEHHQNSANELCYMWNGKLYPIRILREKK